jgi:large subunit ribosomal protein L3
MSLGVVGHKCGMTRVFAEDGTSTPVTVVHVESNTITQLKTLEKDGYTAIQVTMGIKKRSRVNKPEAGHYAKSSVQPGKGLREFRLDPEKMNEISIGKTVDVSLFKENQKVDVTATSKGKGFQGSVKRHNFKTQDASHGNSLSHRAHGSTGQNQTPGRVFKNKKMAGQMGSVKTTVQSLEVFKVDINNGLLLLKGSIPGARNGEVIVRPAVKAKRQ